MTEYFFPIKTAIILFPLIAALFTIPFVLYQYRKHGYVNKLRIIILYSFLLYLLVTYFLIILPLPQTRDTCSLYPPGRQLYQLVPFNFIQDILKETHVVLLKPSTYINFLKERAFLQVAFNLILLTPLGIYLRYYFRRSFKQTVIICFFTSLFFETTQITGLYGIYNCPYRLFDVDDLILNTSGGLIGYLIAPIFTYFLPKPNQLDKYVDLKNMQVGFLRRLIAFYIDWGIISIIISLLHIERNLLVNAIVVFLYFILLIYFTNGKTIGKYLTKIKIRGQHNKLTFKEVLIRYSILYYAIIGPNYLLGIGLKLNTNPVDTLVFFIIAISLNVVIFIHVFIHLITKNKLFFYEKISNTKNVIDR